MNKYATTTRTASSGRIVSKTLGKGKASKFAQVEGISLSQRSTNLISSMEQRGLKGDALRNAITGSFAAKRG